MLVLVSGVGRGADGDLGSTGCMMFERGVGEFVTFQDLIIVGYSMKVVLAGQTVPE